MLSERIKKFRKEREYTQEQLAKAAHITYATLIKLESGVNTNPTLKTLKRISRALNVPITKLIS
ncbi:MAG: helix-turn-helix transcriptional regulator [Candidatus Kerfeldbacteria bacterium]